MGRRMYTAEASRERLDSVISANAAHVEEFGLGTAVINTSLPNGYELTDERALLGLSNLHAVRNSTSD